ncbi:MAG: RHS repeat-associated core domain-containing protein, partial [Ignavibacteriales bacterium]
ASDSTLVGTYTYDAWGKILSANTASSTSDPNGILTKNPFRYRGYYYDKETGFYYLQSRYYNPGLGRFINADTILGTKGELLSHNLFAYCQNNPVIYYDEQGTERKLIGEKEDADNDTGCPSNSSISGGNPSGKPSSKSGNWLSRLLGEIHHIASDKSIKSGFTEAYKKIFDKAGMSLQDDANKIFLEGHSGAHTKAYKQYVLDYITQATEGLSGQTAKDALIRALKDLMGQMIKNPQMPYKGGL